VALLVFKPLTDFLHFPRMSLTIAAVACVPIALWFQVANAWCTGLSKFKLLSVLLFVTVLVRLAVGLILVQFFPVAESGVWATFLMFWVIGSVVIFHKAGPVPEMSSELRSREFYQYLAAAMAVSFGTFLFVQGDQIVAQRYLRGDTFGLYTAAGQLGRAVVWGALPLLSVFFTKRASETQTTRQSGIFIALFLVLAGIGALMLVVLKSFLLKIFIKEMTPDQLAEGLKLVDHFSLGMFLVAVVHAAGFYFLSSGRLFCCAIIGAGGLLHAVTLVMVGTRAETLVSLISLNAIVTILLAFTAGLVVWSRKRKRI
jgi:O-antigen/teichoic acid export membrane protein